MSLSNISLFGGYVAGGAAALLPEHERRDGPYVSASASFGKRGGAWSIGPIVNQPLRSDVVGGLDFLGNVSVNYAFN